jgi:hypothetical protein
MLLSRQLGFLLQLLQLVQRQQAQPQQELQREQEQVLQERQRQERLVQVPSLLHGMLQERRRKIPQEAEPLLIHFAAYHVHLVPFSACRLLPSCATFPIHPSYFSLSFRHSAIHA